MKKLLFVLFLSSCSPSIFNNVSIEGFSHVGSDVYYMGEKCATMTSLEMAYDNKKIVRECTMIITDEKFDQYALNIIKYMRLKTPQWEIEVELKKEPKP
jgi:hypothetical protein